MGRRLRIEDLGEKEIIRSWLRPFLNPSGDEGLPGDDCAVIELAKAKQACVSTDRVPADLISFRLGLIDYYELGHYLAVLNLSDLAAMGAEPAGLLLNFGLPPSFYVADLKSLVFGAQAACKRLSCSIVGGDLSSSAEMSISATSIGLLHSRNVLLRQGCRVGDLVYCTGPIGVTPTAFAYYLRAKGAGLNLSNAEESEICVPFKAPMPAFREARVLLQLKGSITAMDNTDGVAQTLSEIAELNSVGIQIDSDALPIEDISRKVAAFLDEDVVELVLGPGADFQLVGTIPPSQRKSLESEISMVKIIGEVVVGSGVSLRRDGAKPEEFRPIGWDYFGR